MKNCLNLKIVKGSKNININTNYYRIFEAFNKCYILTGKAKIKGIIDYIAELI